MLSLMAAMVLRPAPPIRVFAAASLKEAYTEIARRYESSHPGVSVQLSFAGSQTLAAQIRQGAPADVFASAAQKNLDQVQYDRSSRRIFALNRLAIATRPGLRGVTTLADLPKAQNFIVGAPAVPVGQYTERFLVKAGRVYGAQWLARVRSNVVSREADVKAVLAKVRLGEGDAGVVYSSDIVSAGGQVGRLDIPPNLNETAEYPVAILTYAENPDGAKGFVKYLFTPDAQRIFKAKGFTSPTDPPKSLTIASRTRIVSIPLPFGKAYRQIDMVANDDRNKRHLFHGVPLAVLPGVAKAKTARFEATDGYSKSVDVATLTKNNAILVRLSDGNYQLVVPGLEPKVWVKWLRRITLD